jgi:hypothetical protein
MSQPRGPWFRTGHKAWYVEIGGRQRKLVDGPNDGPTKVRVEVQYHRLMAEP